MTSRSRAAVSLPPSLLPFHIPSLSLPSFLSSSLSLPHSLPPFLSPSFLLSSSPLSFLHLVLIPISSLLFLLPPLPFPLSSLSYSWRTSHAPSVPSCTQLLGERLYLTAQELCAYRGTGGWTGDDPAMWPTPLRPHEGLGWFSWEPCCNWRGRESPCRRAGRIGLGFQYFRLRQEARVFVAEETACTKAGIQEKAWCIWISCEVQGGLSQGWLWDSLIHLLLTSMVDLAPPS